MLFYQLEGTAIGRYGDHHFWQEVFNVDSLSLFFLLLFLFFYFLARYDRIPGDPGADGLGWRRRKSEERRGEPLGTQSWPVPRLAVTLACDWCYIFWHQSESKITPQCLEPRGSLRRCLLFCFDFYFPKLTISKRPYDISLDRRDSIVLT